MAKVSGYGGYVVSSDGADDTNVIQHNMSYTYDYTGVHDDTTDSGTGGYTEETPVVLKFNSAEIDIAEDDEAYAELIGFEPNTVLTVWFKRGADTVYDKVVDCVVEGYSPTNDQQKARKTKLRLVSGAITLAATAPSL